MRKVFIYSFIISVLFASCSSPKKQMESGNYDAAITKAVEKIRKDRNDTKNIDILDQSYKIALEQENEKIRLLKMEGKPQNWDQIYLIYKKMYDRQSLVRTVLPLKSGSRNVDFPYVDYMEEMIIAKNKAADYYFANGQQIMKNGTKDSYRQAYEEFSRAKEYVGDYEGIDKLIEECRYMGISRVLIKVDNRSHINFPPEFEADLLALDLPRLDNQWVEYHTRQLDENIEFDYIVSVIIKAIAVSPDNTFQKDTLIKREIQDGFQYVLDDNGNVMKDTLGNDIKVKKYKQVQCALIESVQNKECVIDGQVEILTINSAKVLKSDPLSANSFFEHISARAIGDIEALMPSEREKTRSEPIPFPSDLEMVIRCSEALKMGIRNAMQRNRRFII
ncbi:MAG TPA: hypothetical protein DEQ09_05765 [Bacteroidales bacterium]|nr:hypothetical protein [Bacteroidales bacterium]